MVEGWNTQINKFYCVFTRLEASASNGSNGPQRPPPPKTTTFLTSPLTEAGGYVCLLVGSGGAQESIQRCSRKEVVRLPTYQNNFALTNMVFRNSSQSSVVITYMNQSATEFGIIHNSTGCFFTIGHLLYNQ